ncbi:amidase [Natrononativus amylolyticus]|uniref:amidase n=1 Tax=Natrononativus amylolyticus TaxID=2963434 RepID=UPI0020CD7F03|nr:amidase [Natrononativus amylolyticus]
MVPEPPSRDELRALGESLHLDLTDEELEDFEALVEGTLGMYETVQSASSAEQRSTPGAETRESSRATDDDPYNAWITRCDVSRDVDGPLSGWRIGLKDNVSLAGVEMTCGSAVMEGYVPSIDAEIVDRLLDAGGRIVGKNAMDDMAFAGNGSSGAFGPTVNPRSEDHLAGGSSAGGAAAVAAGEVDLAIGTDQGGSVRVPAAWTGVVGHKPTFGLVPYTGIVGLRHPLDHVGTFTNSTTDAARTLTVLAGRDPFDSRQPEPVPAERYERALDGDVTDLAVGVVEEGFGREGSDPAVDEMTRDAIDRLADAGATVESVSVPSFEIAPDVYTVAMLEGLVATVRSETLGYNRRGWHDTDLATAFGRLRRERGGALPATVKVGLLAGAYANDAFHATYYAKAMNLLEEMTETYDDLFDAYDLLAMPASPETAQRRRPNIGRIEFVARAWTSLANASVFNVTGHPALSVPAGQADGLSVGLQLVGERFADATVLNAGYALEGTG